MLMRTSRNTPMRFSALMGTPPPHPALRATFPASGEVTYLILHPSLVGTPPRHPALRATFPASGEVTYLILHPSFGGIPPRHPALLATFSASGEGTYLILHRALSSCGIGIPGVLGDCCLALSRSCLPRRRCLGSGPSLLIPLLRPTSCIEVCTGAAPP